MKHSFVPIQSRCINNDTTVTIWIYCMVTIKYYNMEQYESYNMEQPIVYFVDTRAFSGYQCIQSIPVHLVDTRAFSRYQSIGLHCQQQTNMIRYQKIIPIIFFHYQKNDSDHFYTHLENASYIIMIYGTTRGTILLYRQNSRDLLPITDKWVESGLFSVRIYFNALPRGLGWVMLGYVRLYQVMFGYVRLCQVMLGYIRLCQVMLGHVRLCQVMLGYVRLCQVMLCQVMLCQVILCQVMLCYVMLCYVMLGYVMLGYVLSVGLVRLGSLAPLPTKIEIQPIKKRPFVRIGVGFQEKVC